MKKRKMLILVSGFVLLAAEASGGDAAPAPLPEAGLHPARTIFTLVEKTSGIVVRPTHPGLSEIEVAVAPGLAGRPGNLALLKALLWARKIAVERNEDADGTAFWRASRVLIEKEPSSRQLTQVFQTRKGTFRRAVEEVDRYLLSANGRIRADQAPSLAVSVPETGRIIVRTDSSRVLDVIEEILRGVGSSEKYPDHETRLYVHRAQHHMAPVLYDRLLGFFDAEESSRIRVVFPRRTNALWIRTHPALWKKVERALKVADLPAEKSSAAKPAARPARPVSK